MLNLFILSLTICAAIFAIHKTSIIPELASFLGSKTAAGFLKTSFVGVKPNYFQFLLDSGRQSFWLRLAACSVCLSFHISWILCLLSNYFWWSGAVWILSIVFFAGLNKFLDLTKIS